MVDLDLQNKAFKLAWAIRIIDTNATWGIIPKGYFNRYGGLKFLLRCNYDISKLKISLPQFYKDILEYWKALSNSKPPTSCQEAISEILWNNKFILVDGKSFCYKKWLDTGVTHVRDLIDEEGNFMTY